MLLSHGTIHLLMQWISWLSMWILVVNSLLIVLVKLRKVRCVCILLYTITLHLGEEKGTPHVQCVLYRRGGLNYKKICKAFKGLRLTSAFNEDYDTMRAYCTKEETSVAGSQFEAGAKPVNGGAPKKLEALINEVKGGEITTLEAAIDSYGPTAMRVYKGVERYISMKTSAKPSVPADPRIPRERVMNLLWYYGMAGTGKSSRAKLYCHLNGLTLFEKTSEMKQWWDGYQNEDAILLDDFRASDMTFHSFLQLTDPYRKLEHKVQVKGGDMLLKAKVIIVTSPRHPIDIWKCTRKEDNDWQQLKRRLTSVGLCEYWLAEPDFDPSTGLVDMTNQDPPPPPQAAASGHPDDSHRIVITEL